MARAMPANREQAKVMALAMKQAARATDQAMMEQTKVTGQGRALTPATAHQTTATVLAMTKRTAVLQAPATAQATVMTQAATALPPLAHAILMRVIFAGIRYGTLVIQTGFLVSGILTKRL
ncbi:hypothetical protein T9A_00233 [Alcanivorax jadensis T9]|uniref:Uncharacterized protein n=1 Tax=Alcanivorax jadensis T9 TaxID=1177181 RepID=A0ABR4WH38_9GAMM|nr:hypothetical protein T9A_00233 [Alcanivorax jadensis T9]